MKYLELQEIQNITKHLFFWNVIDKAYMHKTREIVDMNKVRQR